MEPNKTNNSTIIIDKSYKPMLIEGLSDEAYHSDKTAVNSSSLKKMLKSPASFKEEYFGGSPKQENEAMKFGRLVHLAILEGSKFRERYAVLPTFVGRTKDGRESSLSSSAREKKAEWLTEQQAQNKIVCTQEELDSILRMMDSITNHAEAFNLLKDGLTEVSGYFSDPETGILNRIRPDFLSFDLMALVDLKTTTDCTASEFSRTIWQLRYDFQMAMYSEGIRQICGKEVRYHAYIAIEKTPPYEVAVYIADEGLLGKGSEDYHTALRRLQQCLDKNEWPGYQSGGLQSISLPGWVF